MRKLVLALLLNEPVIVVLPLALTDEVNTGKFCRLFGPESDVARDH